MAYDGGGEVREAAFAHETGGLEHLGMARGIRLLQVKVQRAEVIAAADRLGLFVVGPVAGILLVGLTFGLPSGLQRLAAAMFVFSLALLGLLVRGEYVRLSRRSRW